MPPNRVIEHLDVVEDVGRCVCASRVGPALDPLAFQELEEALADHLAREECSLRCALSAAKLTEFPIALGTDQRSERLKRA